MPQTGVLSDDIRTMVARFAMEISTPPLAPVLMEFARDVVALALEEKRAAIDKLPNALPSINGSDLVSRPAVLDALR